MDPEREAAPLAAALQALGRPARAEAERRYLKSDLVHWGVSVPETRALAKRFLRAHPEIDRAALWAVVDALWGREVHESRLLAAELLVARRDRLQAGDVVLLERLLREARTWALVDPLAVGVLGPMRERFRSVGRVVARWGRDGDHWIRRAALLSHLAALRRGAGDFDAFGRLADGLLPDREFFVRKAIGWVLRDTARRRPELVAGWLAPRAHRASGVTVREAVKPLPERRREAILAAYRAKRPAGA